MSLVSLKRKSPSRAFLVRALSTERSSLFLLSNFRKSISVLLLKVNGYRLLGINHMEVVSVLKELPIHVRMVCGRNVASQDPLCPIDTAQHQAAFQTRVSRVIAECRRQSAQAARFKEKPPRKSVFSRRASSAGLCRTCYPRWIGS